MLEYLDLTKSMPKEQYKEERKALQKELFLVHRKSHELGLRIVVLFEGWDTAGKGSAVQALVDKLDPRGCRVFHTLAPERYEAARPWMWRFWNALPPTGQMVVFDRSWYGRVLVERVDGYLNPRLVQHAYRDINGFERLLNDEGYVIIKFWLHISQEEMERRLKLLSEDPDEAWQVEPEDWDHLAHYHQFNMAAEQMLAATETDYAPWTLVEATDPFWRAYKILNTVLARLKEAVAQAEAARGIVHAPAPAVKKKGGKKGRKGKKQG